jgi:hypothetical protein
VPFVADLGAGVRASVPLAVFVTPTELALGKRGVSSAARALSAPRGGALKEALVQASASSDRATRLASVIAAWNIVQHFYPYPQPDSVTWAQQLGATLQAAAVERPSGGDPTVALERMVATLRDGHAGVSPAQIRLKALPLLLEAVGQRIVILHVADTTLDLRLGDIVETIDGVPAMTVLQAREPLVSAATPSGLRVHTLERIGFGRPDSSLVFVVRAAVDSAVASGRAPTRRVVVPFSSRTTPLETRPPVVAMLRDSIWYVDLTRVTRAQFDSAVPALSQAPGVVFDARGGVRLIGTQTAVGHLLTSRVTTQVFRTPTFTRPNRHAPDTAVTVYQIDPLAPRIRGRVAFLVDGWSLSAVEGIMDVVAFNQLGAIVGEQTSGTNGNLNVSYLPGGLRFTWTGMDARRPDGSPYKGRGVMPTVPMRRTLAGIARGVDEQLERAIAVVRAPTTQLRRP